MRRRVLIGGIAALAAVPTMAPAHTLYGQWIVYRQKHLLVGCHRGDEAGFETAKAIRTVLDKELPEARAQVARAPFPGRLARLLGTDQIPTAVLQPEIATAIVEGKGEFAPYGPVALTAVAQIGAHVLVARADFPEHHGALVFGALQHAGLARTPDAAALGLAVHPGVL